MNDQKPSSYKAAQEEMLLTQSLSLDRLYLRWIQGYILLCSSSCLPQLTFFLFKHAHSNKEFILILGESLRQQLNVICLL